VLTRLGLFVETVTHFLKELRDEEPEAFASLDAGYRRRYLDREGYFNDAKREQARRRLPVVAQDIYALVQAFQANDAVSGLPAFGLLKRLFEEQCEVVEDTNSSDDEGGGTGGGEAGDETKRTQVKLREPKTIASDSLQSPHDPDATYGHKGKGYEAQVSETCNDDNPFQVITGTSVNGAHESDQNAVSPMLDQLENSQMMPDDLSADTGYGSGENIVECAKRGVDLQAPVRHPDAPAPTEHFAAPVADEASAEAPSESACAQDSEPTSVEPESTLGLDAFSFDPTFHKVLNCPAGMAPEHQHMASNNQMLAVFSADHCANCPLGSRCPTRLLAGGQRQLRRAPATIATQVRQAEQQLSAFKERYRKRSGIESTNQELKGRHGMGDLRVRGKPRVELATVLKSLALNVKRAVQYHVLQMADCAPCPY